MIMKKVNKNSHCHDQYTGQNDPSTRFGSHAIKITGNVKRETSVVLRIAKNLTVQDLVDVMSIAARLNLKMVLST